MLIRTFLAAAALVLTIAAAPPRAEAATRQACEALRSLSSATFRVDAAEMVAAGPAAGQPAATAAVLPEHCLFRVVIDPRPGVEDVTFGIGVEVRLPSNWNGRFLFQGGGGLNGVLNPAYGPVAGFAPALARGFAVASHDGGHRGRNVGDARFALDQQARLDFAYRSVERATREAKGLIARYYGQGPRRSYFLGCSTGGREGMMAAQRLPLEYDGVVSGNPTFNLTRIAVNQVWNVQVVNRIAPKGPDGRPIAARAFSEAQLKAVAAGALAACDDLDGLKDGMINDYRACRFDPKSLTCRTRGAPGPDACLTPVQVQGLKDIFGGARDSKGRSLYGSYPYDTGVALPAWRGMHLGSAASGPTNAADATLGANTVRYFALSPPDPALDPLAFDFDKDVARTLETAAVNDATATYLSTFAGRGGKMILYHGLSDQGMSTSAFTDWYDALSPRTAGGPQDWARLFLVPGMTHCGGGQSTDRFDTLSAIQAWVEEGRAPDRIVATGAAFPGTSRPLCPYPQAARYTTGDVADERSFSCR